MTGREPLPVIFRAEWNDSPKTGNIHITAVFPTLPGNSDPRTFTVYARVGQHSAGSKEWYRSTRPATPEEYADLLAELRGIYERDDDSDAVRLVIAKRFTKHHDASRREALR